MNDSDLTKILAAIENKNSMTLDTKKWLVGVVGGLILYAFGVGQFVSVVQADVSSNKNHIKNLESNVVTIDKLNDFQKQITIEKEVIANKVVDLQTNFKELSGDVKALTQAINKNQINQLKRDSNLERLILSLQKK